VIAKADTDLIAADRDRAVPTLRSADDRGSGGGAKRTARLLIVEDDFLAAVELEDGLKEAGFDVVGLAASASEAVRLAECMRPALVIMDIRLAGGSDGIDAAAEIFNRFGIRSIFASAFHDPATRARAEAAAPLGWLPKPYSIGGAVAIVRSSLEALR
jgi:DNA-binding NarL/FixJ family response regulator